MHLEKAANGKLGVTSSRESRVPRCGKLGGRGKWFEDG